MRISRFAGATIPGDFVLTAAEVNPVLRTLRQNGIKVTPLGHVRLACS